MIDINTRADIDARIEAIPLQYAELSTGRLSYRDAGAGTAVIFLHGIGSGSASWLLQFEGLVGHCRCLAWDAPGYGQSAALALDRPKAQDYVAVLREWLHNLELKQYHLVAHSLGALFAGAHCRPPASLPQTLTFISPTLGHGARPEAERTAAAERRIRTFDELGADGLADIRAQALLSAAASTESLAIVHWNMSRLRRRGYHQATHILANTDLLNMATDINIPVTLMCGTADEITPEPLSRRLAAVYRGSKYLPLEGCGHAAYIEGATTVNNRLRRQFESAGDAPMAAHTVAGRET